MLHLEEDRTAHFRNENKEGKLENSQKLRRKALSRAETTQSAQVQRSENVHSVTR